MRVCYFISIVSGLLLEFDNDASHVVCTDSARGKDVRSDDPLEHIFDAAGYLASILTFLKGITHLLDSLFGCATVPDSVTCQNEELVSGLSGDLLNLGINNDHLLCVGEVVLGLVLEITH